MWNTSDRDTSFLLAGARGFSFVEVVIALATTIVILGAVFGLLARSLRTTPVEMERADLQAQARHALDRISRDVLLAGTDLPPEFPAFTPPGINTDLDAMIGESDAIEIVGNLSRNSVGGEPIRVSSFDGQTAFLATETTQIRQGDLVLVYDDEPENGAWMFGLVAAVQAGPNPALMLKTTPGATVGDTTLPSFIESYNRSRPDSGWLTPVTVVTYVTDLDDTVDGAPAERVLWRQVNWGESQQVAYLESLRIRYFVGDTVDDPVVPVLGPPGHDIQSLPPKGPKEPKEPKNNKNRRDLDGLQYAPFPQPDPLAQLQGQDLVHGVRIQVTSRSHQANLEGSELLADESTSDDGYIRATLSTRVSPRNLLFRLSNREYQ